MIKAIIFVVSALVFSCFGVWLLFGALEEEGTKTKIKIKRILTMPVMTIGFISALMGLKATKEWNRSEYDKSLNKKYSSIEDKIQNNYDIYINGIKVDPDHITLRDYSPDCIVTNDDTKEIQIAANK